MSEQNIIHDEPMEEQELSDDPLVQMVDKVNAIYDVLFELSDILYAITDLSRKNLVATNSIYSLFRDVNNSAQVVFEKDEKQDMIAMINAQKAVIQRLMQFLPSDQLRLQASKIDALSEIERIRQKRERINRVLKGTNGTNVNVELGDDNNE